jgi:hypothetical protein
MGIAPPWRAVRKRSESFRHRAAAGSPQPVAPPPLRALAFAAHEWPKLATNGLDLSQGLPSKFDLSLEHADVPQCNRRDHKVVNVVLQATEGGLNPEHFQSPTQQYT